MQPIHAIPELLDLIIGLVSLSDLPNLARTCRDFFGPAARRLWGSTDSIKHLLNCLPESSFETTYDRQFRRQVLAVTRKLEPQDLARLKLYSKLIREIRISPGELHIIGVHEVVRALNGDSLCPNLRRLVYEGPSIWSSILPHLTSSSLSRVHINLNSDACGDRFFSRGVASNELAYLFALKTQQPSSVTVLRLICVEEEGFSELAGLLHGWDSLHDLCIDGDVPMKAVVALPALRSLSINLPVISAARSRTLQDECRLRDSLKTLSLRSAAMPCTILFLAALADVHLVELALELYRDNHTETILQLCQAVQQCCCHRSLQRLSLTRGVFRFQTRGMTVPYNLDDIRPLLAFENMVDFRLIRLGGLELSDGEMLALVEAWPRLEVFHVDSDRRRPRPALSLLGMIWAIARGTPHLRDLCIPVDASGTDIPRGTSADFAQDALTRFGVLHSPIASEYRVASLLSRFFPSLREIEVEREETPENMRIAGVTEAENQRRRKWRNVQEALPEFVDARMTGIYKPIGRSRPI
ncbi:hypothetical protein BD626DRAFT_31444 [Schizophyllum amplum]|uniref:F-box domain-containing protein n=1 Tax=Schizophyllum amplum TaxID=97359 RepID=A0A550D0S9_9AGAR|nr:hypothetical protein BD626DRAFT_31444 [Auriculariopsis ampla]